MGRFAKFHTVLFLLTSVIGCASFRFPALAPDPVDRLREAIDLVLADSIFVPARSSIKIASLESGEVLYERDAELLTRPASNMKLLTSAAAIATLGRLFTFRTEIYSDPIGPDGIVQGNLYIKGYGNPDFRSADLDTLVHRLLRSGIKGVTGGVVADVSYFDDEYWGFGWNWDDEPYQYAAFLSPLSINDNCVTVTVSPGAGAGDPARISIEPATSYVSYLNFARTVSDTALRPLNVTRLFKQRMNTLVIQGEILPDSQPSRHTISVWRPERYAAHLMTEALGRHGVRIRNLPSIVSWQSDNTPLITHVHPLDSVIVNLNKISDNLSAELLLKTMGAERRGAPGTARNGIAVVNEFLSSLGIDTTRIFIADGSGLSFYNLLTAKMLVQFLQGVALRPNLFPLFYESLPIAGVDGTLRNRMKGTAAEGNLRAKTGTISGVSSLSGYVTTRDGERLVFSMSMQNFIYPTRLYQAAQDSIGALLARFSRTSRIAVR